jgi:EAL domain-containing protein (putative c-di-GMP-specific phosphodiesterase class I)
VEGLAQFNFLREASVEIAQGYYFGRPMTAEDLAETAKRLTVMEQCPLER